MAQGSPTGNGSRELDAVVVGAGVAGLYSLHRLRGLGLSTRVFEAGHDVGGTWYWNRYPGARCDIESMEYSYQFSDELQQEWEWTERYATQPEILRYLEHVADRFDLRRDIQFDTRVTAATFDEAVDRWVVETDDGARFSARFCIMATGCLSSPNDPDIPGLDSFAGRVFHTGRWPHEGVDFSGRRVGVIGTGSSAIQSIPLIADEAAHLSVFQRTPNYSVPAHNQPLDPDYVSKVRADYAGFRARNAQMGYGFGSDMPSSEKLASASTPEERDAAYEARWERGGLFFLGSFADLIIDAASNETAAEFLRTKIRGLVDDPAVAELLCPDNVMGCKRPCVDTGYYATFNRPHVELVDVRSAPIEAITEGGLRTTEAEYAFDDLVLATGFDAMTGTLLRIDIRGRGGATLADAWAAGPRAYLGLAVAGFPNLFTITGPGSPSVLSNMIPSIEQHVNWIGDCIAYIEERGLSTIEATPEAQDAWVSHVNEIADFTLYPTCNSWYLGANIPGKPRVFMPYIGFPPYLEKCQQVVANHYEGFATS